MDDSDDDDFWNDVLNQIDLNQLPTTSPTAISSAQPAPDQKIRSELDEDALKRLPAINAKAGMKDVNAAQVAQTIYELSKDSLFYADQRRKHAQTTARINAMLEQSKRLSHHDIAVNQLKVDKIVKQLRKECDRSRLFVHVDMDAFYAAVETLNHPELASVPMAIGSTSMLSTANYEARKFGVRAAMPGFIALKLCPKLVIRPLNFPLYKSISEKIRTEVLEKYDPNVTMMSLDEGYLDVTDYVHSSGRSVEDIVQELREKIKEVSGITASAGISCNKMLAKVCSDINKPNGQYYLENKDIDDFIKSLPVRKVPGIGSVTERMLNALDITTCGEIFEKRAILCSLFQPATFDFLLNSSLGVGSTDTSSGPRKSISCERTFSSLSDPPSLFAKLYELAQELSNDLKKQGVKGRVVTVKMKLTDFSVRVRAKSLSTMVDDGDEIYKVAEEIFKAELPLTLRLLGIKVSSLVAASSSSIDSFFKEQNEEAYESFRCPVCQQIVVSAAKTEDNLKFNEHIDVCLNRDTVKSLANANDPANPVKKRAQDAKEKGQKRMKTITDYFTKQ